MKSMTWLVAFLRRIWTIIEMGVGLWKSCYDFGFWIDHRLMWGSKVLCDFRSVCSILLERNELSDYACNGIGSDSSVGLNDWSCFDGWARATFIGSTFGLGVDLVFRVCVKHWIVVGS